MSKTAVEVASPAVRASSKKAKLVTAKQPASKATHPQTAEMVNASLAALKDKKGSSLSAIKKYIAITYKLDVDKQAFHIKKYLKSAIENETIVQTKGKGASGSFKLAKVQGDKMALKSAAKEIAAAKKPATKKSTAAKKPTKVGAGKDSARKKSAVDKKAASVKPKIVKSPSKAKKGRQSRGDKIVASKAKSAKK